jgi:hypothetical protein
MGAEVLACLAGNALGSRTALTGAPPDGRAALAAD